jgi:hypothetical protein
MSALAMILAAAMTVPGDGAEKVSAEIAASQPLDLRGEWNGVWETGRVNYAVKHLVEGEACSYQQIPKGRWGPAYLIPKFVDEGVGRLRLQWVEDGPCLGIYKQDGERLTICFRDARKGRPQSFRTDHGQNLLILHRVKPSK